MIQFRGNNYNTLFFEWYDFPYKMLQRNYRIFSTYRRLWQVSWIFSTKSNWIFLPWQHTGRKYNYRNTPFIVPWKYKMNFPGGASAKEPVCQCRRREETEVQSLGGEDPLEEGMASHSSILAWRILWTEIPGTPQFKVLQRVEQNWSNLACTEIWNMNKLKTCFKTFMKKTLLKDIWESQ